MEESQESTAGAPKEESLTQSQSTNEPGSSSSIETIILAIGLVGAGILALIYVNRRMARDSAEAMWQAEEEYHGKRLFGDAWDAN